MRFGNFRRRVSAGRLLATDLVMLTIVAESQAFQPWSGTHAAVVVVFFAGTAFLVSWRRRSGGDGSRPLDRGLAIGAAVLWLVVNGWQMLPGRFTAAQSIPLHLCDLTLLAVPLALGAGFWWARAILYFWGLGLSSQGFFTPDLQDGPARAGFWFFWLSHAAVVGGAVYDLAGRGYRPTWRDCGFALLAGFGYAAVVLPLDVLKGYNYGYLGETPPGQQPTLIDKLGPWPGRVVLIALLVSAAMALLMVPWELARRWSTPHAAEEPRA